MNRVVESQEERELGMLAKAVATLVPYVATELERHTSTSHFCTRQQIRLQQSAQEMTAWRLDIEGFSRPVYLLADGTLARHTSASSDMSFYANVQHFMDDLDSDQLRKFYQKLSVIAIALDTLN